MSRTKFRRKGLPVCEFMLPKSCLLWGTSRMKFEQNTEQKKSKRKWSCDGCRIQLEAMSIVTAAYAEKQRQARHLVGTRGMTVAMPKGEFVAKVNTLMHKMKAEWAAQLPRMEKATKEHPVVVDANEMLQVYGDFEKMRKQRAEFRDKVEADLKKGTEQLKADLSDTIKRGASSDKPKVVN